MYDVIIVGARCAGAITALRFARSGHSVLVLEKNRLGSDALSTHVLAGGAVKHLDNLDLLQEILATGAPPVRTFLAEFDGQSYASLVEGGNGFLLSVRRTTLDPILVAAAERAGARFHFGARVEQLTWDDGRVVGVQGMAAGEPFAAEAKLVVGADGRHSVVAHRVAAQEYNTLPSKSAALYAYFRGVGPTTAGSDFLQFASGPGCDILCCPCDGGLHVVLLVISPDEFARVSTSDGATYDARLRSVPTLAPRLAEATRVSQVYPASGREIRGYFRDPYGPGWALVGDAGYYAHPAAANGISDAFRSAELLHEHVARAWEHGHPAETYLDQYQATRDAENDPAFHFSYRLGHVNPFRDPEIAASVMGVQQGA